MAHQATTAGRLERLSLADPVARAGEWLRDHQGAIRRTQWAVVFVYVALLVVPALAPLPTRTAHIWSHVTLAAQFLFWGIWWPFVLVSMVLVGRSWCGMFCPEGALSEMASRRGLARATPRWIKWRGWPFVAFACTTIYGQMISVYQYPKPVIVVLGGSTVAAIAIGALYGRDKRVWCRYLCPVNGVFGLLAKLSPLRYRVDGEAWSRWKSGSGAAGTMVNCAPLVPVRKMKGASTCHMCGRCAGYKGAVALELRSPAQEIVEVAGLEAKPWETVLIVFGLMGIAAGAFQWTTSPWFVGARQWLAERLVERDWTALVEPILPWWILTNYPEQNDMMSPLDGGLMIAYVLATALAVGVAVLLALALATRALGRFETARLHHLAQSLVPIAGCGVFLGLSALTITMLRVEGFALSFAGAFRVALLAGAALWSLWLAWRISGRYTQAPARRFGALAGVALAVAVGVGNWVLLFWVW
jgi:polyferredoxin